MKLNLTVHIHQSNTKQVLTQHHQQIKIKGEIHKGIESHCSHGSIEHPKAITQYQRRIKRINTQSN